MKYRVLNRFTAYRPALALLATALFMLGCEGENRGASAPAQQAQPSMQASMPNQDAAIEVLKARLFDDPDNSALLSALGDAYFQQRRFDEAIPIYKRAIVFNPEDFDALNDLGLAYHYTGNSQAALEALERSISANLDYKYARLSKGFILLSLGRHEEAEAPLRKALALDPNGNIGAEAGRMLGRVEVMRAAN